MSCICLDWFVPLCLTETELFYSSDRLLYFSPSIVLTFCYLSNDERHERGISLNCRIYLYKIIGRSSLKRKCERRKREKIVKSVHIFQLREGRGNKSGSGVRLNKKNSAGLISKERTGERRWTKCKLLHKPR